jgi:hypothetical protein
LVWTSVLAIPVSPPPRRLDLLVLDFARVLLVLVLLDILSFVDFTVVGRRFLRGCLAEVVSITLEDAAAHPTMQLTHLSLVGLRQDHRGSHVNFFTRG